MTTPPRVGKKSRYVIVIIKITPSEKNIFFIMDDIMDDIMDGIMDGIMDTE